jgi:hypothetical protein
VIQTDINPELSKPGTDGCPEGETPNGPVTGKICPKVAILRGEPARAKERD